MALPKQVISVPFAAGTDEKTTQQVLQPGAQAQIVNAVFTKTGSLRKRYGIKRLGTAPASQPRKLASYQNELVATVCDDAMVRSYTTGTAGGSNWPNRNYAPECVVTRSNLPIPSSVSGITAYDIAINGDSACVVWVTDTYASGNKQMYAAIIAVSTGALIRYDKIDNGNAENPRVAALGGNFVIAYAVPASRQIILYANSATAPTVWAAGININNAQGAIFDFCALSGNTARGLLVYETTAAMQLTVTLVANNGTSAASTTASLGFTNWTAVGIARQARDTDSTLYFAVTHLSGTDNVTSVVGVNSSLVVTTGPTTIITQSNFQGPARTVAVSQNSTTVSVITGSISGGGTGGVPMTSWIRCVNGAISTTQVDTRRVSVLSTPYYNSVTGSIYFHGFFNIATSISSGPFTAQCTGYLFEITKPGFSPIRVVATYAPLVCTADLSITKTFATNIAPLANGTQFWSLADINTINTTQVPQLLTIDFGLAGIGNAVEASHELAMSGGVPSYYDGPSVAEQGFLHYPEGLTATASAPGGGLIGTGTYSYIAVFEYYDAQGQYHQSAPSPPVSVTVTNPGTNAVTLSVPCLNLTQREFGWVYGTAANRVGLAIYRTTAGGTVYHRVIADQVPSGLMNYQLSGFVNYNDLLADASITANRVLYNTGGAQAKIQPPSCAQTIVHKQRLWNCGGDDARNVWFSGTFSDGDAPWFSPVFIQRFDEPIVALASLDDRLVAFSNHSIFICSGDGPSDSGQGSDLTQPRRVSSNVGCVDPRSVVKAQDGYFFMSEQGLYMLTRSEEIQYIGKFLEDTIGSNGGSAGSRSVTSAVLLEDQIQQRFTLAAYPRELGFANSTLVWDDVQKQWTVSAYLVGATTVANPIGGVFWRGGQVYCFASQADGFVYQEDKTTSLDTAATAQWVPLTIKSAWIRPQPQLGFARIWNVAFGGQYNGDHNLTMQFTYNYGQAGPTDTFTWQIGGTSTITGADLNEMVIAKPTRQKCESIQVIISDATPTGSGTIVGAGHGPIAISLDFEIAMKKGLNKLPAVARF